MLNIIVSYGGNELLLKGTRTELKNLYQLLDTLKEDFEDTLLVPDEPASYGNYCTKIRIEPSQNWITITDKWGTHEISPDKCKIARQGEILVLKGAVYALRGYLRYLANLQHAPHHTHVEPMADPENFAVDSLAIVIMTTG